MKFKQNIQDFIEKFFTKSRADTTGISSLSSKFFQLLQKQVKNIKELHYKTDPYSNDLLIKKEDLMKPEEESELNKVEKVSSIEGITIISTISKTIDDYKI